MLFRLPIIKFFNRIPEFIYYITFSEVFYKTFIINRTFIFRIFFY